VGQDAVHFNNPLLPDTRSEMALPLLARGIVIGALDVQSEKPHAFTNDDVETLQIMADQVTSAIENARLFEQTQRRLKEQAMLYSIGTKIGGTLKLQETTDILVTETAEALNCAQCALSLLDENQTVHVLSDYVRKGSSFGRQRGPRPDIQSSESWARILADKQEFILHIDEVTTEGLEATYLKEHNGTALVITPILLRNEVIGTLEVYDDQPGRRFKYQDVTLLDSIALLAANAIENARLYESIHESQSFMKAIIDQIPDPIFIKDRDHKWVVVNTAFAEGILGQPENKILGASDHDFLPEKQADWFWKFDNKMFETGLIQEAEEPITDFEGNLRTLYTRSIPLNLSPEEDKPDYLIGIINDVTDRKQREAERERLIEETRKTLDRTQTLYRISNLLAAADEQQATFEAVLVEYLNLLRLKQGRILLHDKALNANVARARVARGKPVSPSVIIAVDKDRVFQQLLKDPTPIQVLDPRKHRLTKGRPDLRGRARIASMLFIPLVIRKQLLGTIILDATASDYEFERSDIEIGESIADQLTIWLENRRLFTEAQYRSDLLQTAAGVSRAASSILEVETLINTSVNLIRDQFDFYYVGLFLVDEAREWAVLQAGTGEAGRIQLDKNHRLEVGGESMIGWSIKHRQARIALDVGEEAVHFKNPILPETHSEMALPLKSRDEVIGALTVQSVERGAFSDEDIVLLQTMADQLANAIKNAYLFTQTQEVLAETEVLYQVDSSAIYMYLDSADQEEASPPEQIVEQKEVWTRSGTPASPNGTRFRAADFALEQLVPQHGWHLIDDVGDSENISEQMQEALSSIGITSLLILPLSTHQRRLGFLVAAYKSSNRRFSQKQIRFHTAIAQQVVTALENLRLLDASQRRARREEVIREITLKIRNAVDVDDILKTTVVELGKVLGASRGNITLGVEKLAAPAQTRSRRGNGSRISKVQDDGQSDNPAKNNNSAG
jgi:PAS domain S-box-containing protein